MDDFLRLQVEKQPLLLCEEDVPHSPVPADDLKQVANVQVFYKLVSAFLEQVFILGNLRSFSQSSFLPQAQASAKTLQHLIKFVS